MSLADLWPSHAAAWDSVWQGGLEVQGNDTVATAINASLYAIYIAVRDDWPFGLSPGGLARNSYEGTQCLARAAAWMWGPVPASVACVTESCSPGHSFWDCETCVGRAAPSLLTA